MIITVVLCFALQYFLPWWTVAVGAAIAGYAAGNKLWIAFLAGFAGGALLWLTVAFYSDLTTHSILTEKVNRLMPMSSMLMTTLIGGLVGAFAGLTGAATGKLR